MNEKIDKVIAPYNFVPFSNKVILVGEPPKLNSTDKNLISGEIKITLTAETPILVAEEGNDIKQRHFFKGANGKYLIPGSTIKGLIRENMNILGFGYVHLGENFEDYQIYYRNVADPRNGNMGKIATYYKNTLDVDIKKTAGGKSFSKPNVVKAGYIVKEENQYRIYPAKGNYIRISRKNQKLINYASPYPEARIMKCKYKTGIKDEDVSLLSINSSDKNAEEGILLFTGKAVGNKENAVYLFPEINRDSTEKIDVPEKDIVSYKMDLEFRKNILKSKYGSIKFWDLPKDDEEPKPVFYTEKPIDEHYYFGMSLFLRIGFKHQLSEGLPMKHIDIAKEERFLDKMDYPHAILGYSDDENSRRSRVSFGDFVISSSLNEVKQGEGILLGSKPSYFPAYVMNKKNYNDDDFRLRGYKQYWQKKMELPKIEKGMEKVASVLYSLPEGTKFSGTIRFKNLKSDEVGLLLWCLKLEDGCKQTLGSAKPFGFGRVDLSIDGYYEYDFEKLYSEDAFSYNPLANNLVTKVNEYINIYKAIAEGEITVSEKKKSHKGKHGLMNEASVSAFINIHKYIINDNNLVRYMDLNEYTETKKNEGKLELERIPDIIKFDEENNKDNNKVESYDDKLAKLLNKFNG